MHDPNTAGRRRNQDSTFAANPPAKLPKRIPINIPSPEPYHAVPTQTQAIPEETPPDAETEVLTPEPASVIPLPCTYDEAMVLYHAAKGSCPLCKIRIKQGITGHLAKCLPIWNSSSESPTTT